MMRIAVVLLALGVVPMTAATAQDAMEVPAFVSGAMRFVLRPGDRLQLGRLDACERPASQSEAQVEAVYTDSIVLRTPSGRLLLRAGAGDALATAYQPMGGVPEPSVSQTATTVGTGVALAAGGAALGAVVGAFSTLFTVFLYPPGPYVTIGAIAGGLMGLVLAADLTRVNAPVTSRLSGGWGQLELRRDVRAAACEFRPAP